MRCQARPEPSNQPPVCPRREISPYLSAIPLRRLKLRSKGRIRGEEEEKEREREEEEIRDTYLSPIISLKIFVFDMKIVGSMESVLVRYDFVWK